MPNVAGVEYPYTPEGIAAAQQAERQIGKMGPISDMAVGPYMPNLSAGLDPARMSPPLTSPSHPMAQRRVPDLQPASRYHSDYTAWRGAASRSPSSPHATAPTYEDRYTMQSDPNRLYSSSDRDAAIRGADYARSPSNPMAQRPPATQRPIQDLQPYNDPPIQGQLVGGGVLSSLGYSTQNMPSRQELGNVMQYGHRGVHAPSGRDLYDFSEMRSTPSSPWYRPIAQAPRGRTIETSGPANYGQSPSNPNWKPGE